MYSITVPKFTHNICHLQTILSHTSIQTILFKYQIHS